MIGWRKSRAAVVYGLLAALQLNGRFAVANDNLPAWALGPFIRPAGVNPVIEPDPNSLFDCPLRKQPVHWEALHTFNPAAVVRDGKICVLYRAEDNTGAMAIGGHTSRLGLAVSEDGLHFTRRSTPIFYPAEDDQKANEWQGGCEDPRVVQAEDGTYVLTYTQWNGKIFRIGVATSRDLINWTKHGPAFATASGGKYLDWHYKSSGIVCRLSRNHLVAARIQGKYWMYWGEGAIHLASSEDLANWQPVEDERGDPVVLLGPRAGKFDSAFPEVGPPPVLTNKGLSAPQPTDTLPRSAVPPQVPTRKPRLAHRPELKPEANGDLVLSQGWEMIAAPDVKLAGAQLSRPGIDTHAWYDATVPGTVLTTLVDQGVYPDPYFGLNNLAIPETLNKQDYWYRVSFKLPARDTGKQIWITFNGINYRAEVWLNGARCGQITGAFNRGVFNITALASTSTENLLAVRISPPPHPGIPHEQSWKARTGPNGGAMCQDGPTFFATEGWDWIPAIRDRSSGIWQDVVLHATGPVTLADPQVVTDLNIPDNSRADLTIRANLHNAAQQEERGILRGTIEQTTFQQPVLLQPGETRTVVFDPGVFPQLRVNNPGLWWPNGYGKPELHQLKLSFLSIKGQESDSLSAQFGIRTFTYKFDPYLTLRVNGVKVMCKGGNWGMDDAMKRVSRKRLEPYIRMHRDAHLTMIRNWCGQSTEEALYSLCDQYGILVWNEFWISTAGYNLEPADPDLFLANARDTITRFRNHPSIAVWCGRNEGVPPPPINEGLAALTRDLDGTRYYQPSSININLLHSGPWGYQDPASYFTRFARGFTTELGLASVPTIDAMQSMIPGADLWPISDDWAYHDFAPGAQDPRAYMAAMEAQLGKPVDAADFCRKAQLINYVSHRAMFEAWNSKLFNPCSGLLIWMSHPAWASTVWQLYSWDYEPDASLFAAQKGCEPVHIQMNLPDSTVAVINNTPRPLENVKVSARVYSLDARLTWSNQASATAALTACTNLFHVAWPGDAGSTVSFLKLELRDSAGALLSENFYWHAPREIDLVHLNDLPGVTLAVNAHTKREGEQLQVTAEIRNSSPGVALMTQLSLRDARTSKRVLPAFYSDNYLSLLPGESRTITIECAAEDAPSRMELELEGWNVPVQRVSCILLT